MALDDIYKLDEIPENGWILVNVNGELRLAKIANGLPKIQELDDGKMLIAENSEWVFRKITPSDIGLSTVFKIKGSKSTASELPETGDIGDVWYVADESVGYVWIEDDQSVERWEALGPMINLTSYQTKAITDPGSYFTSDTVEGALQELGAKNLYLHKVIYYSSSYTIYFCFLTRTQEPVFDSQEHFDAFFQNENAGNTLILEYARKDTDIGFRLSAATDGFSIQFGATTHTIKNYKGNLDTKEYITRIL